MIHKQRTLFYFVGDQAFKDLAEAQKADLMAMMPESFTTRQEVAQWLLENQKAICDTLQTTPRSRLKARKFHGAVRKPRQPKAEAATS